MELALERGLVFEPEPALVSKPGLVVEPVQVRTPVVQPAQVRVDEPVLARVLELALERTALSELAEVRFSEWFAHPAPFPWPARFPRSGPAPLR